MTIRAILLDLGQVLVRFDHMTTCAALAPRLGLTPDEVHGRLFRSGLELNFETGRLTEAEFAEEAIRRLGGRPGAGGQLGPEDVLDAWARIFTREEGNLRALGPLATAFPLLLLSNTNPTHFREVLRVAPEVGAIPHRVLSFEVGLRKPDPAIYRAALDRLGVPAHECAFLDDRPENLEPAAALGIAAVLHPPGSSVLGHLEALGVRVA